MSTGDPIPLVRQPTAASENEDAAADAADPNFAAAAKGKKKTALVVLGMHRSGTSVLTRMLSLLGGELPTSLMPGDAYNEGGYWESQAIMDLNDAILHSAGSAWDEWDRFDPAWKRSPLAPALVERARVLIKREFRNSDFYILKDPRISRMLEFWAETIRESGADPRIVIAIRNPSDVGASIETRDGIDPTITRLIWLRHLLDAEFLSRDLPRSFVLYEDIFGDWQALARKIAADLDIVWPATSNSVNLQIDEAISTKLHHHRTPKERVAMDPALSPWIKSTFEILCRLAKGERQAQDFERLDRIRREFEESSANFTPAILVGHRSIDTLRAQKEKIESLGEERNFFRREVRDLLGHIDSLRIRHERETSEMRTDHERETGELRADHERETGEMRAEHEREREELQRESSQRIEKMRRVHDDLSVESAEKSLRIDELEFHVDNLEREKAGFYDSWSWKITAPMRAITRRMRFVSREIKWWLTQPLSQSGRYARAALRRVRIVYHRIPFGGKIRSRVRNLVIRYLPWLWRNIDGSSLSSPLESKDEPDVFVPFAPTPIDPREIPVRLIAFYLPQFHPFPENDAWWGKGFTEWTNVSKARPNYAGHYQPRLPSDMGFYDLRISEIMEQQAEIARHYGIHGFCYHYYWFDGHRLLEMPLERMLESGRPDFPFCLSWANENWTRRWDGAEHEILIAQNHSPDDDIGVIRDLMRYMRHPNYIRIDGKPLLMAYRISLFPDIKATVERWREACLREGIGEIYLGLIGSFEHGANDVNPADCGMDAVIEYPPHHFNSPIELPGERLNPDFAGIVNSYPEICRKYIRRNIAGRRLFRGIMPDWDNTARRQNHANIYHDSTPDHYKKWLRFILGQTMSKYEGDERLVFINAWNEWAEGAYLEPDRKFGYAYLDATRSALEETHRATSAADNPQIARSE